MTSPDSAATLAQLLRRAAGARSDTDANLMFSAAEALDTLNKQLAEADAAIAADQGELVQATMKQLTHWQNEALERHASRAGQERKA